MRDRGLGAAHPGEWSSTSGPLFYKPCSSLCPPYALLLPGTPHDQARPPKTPLANIDACLVQYLLFTWACAHALAPGMLPMAPNTSTNLQTCGPM